MIDGVIKKHLTLKQKGIRPIIRRTDRPTVRPIIRRTDNPTYNTTYRQTDSPTYNTTHRQSDSPTYNTTHRQFDKSFNKPLIVIINCRIVEPLFVDV
jgi:hypothetical protein